jgi:hypothetical protein
LAILAIRYNGEGVDEDDVADEEEEEEKESNDANDRMIVD